jgi:NTP pyrophosphatase (non-canonical NTP hydrolase)
MNNIKTLTDKIDKFAKDRDWDKFHSPKNLSMALIAEAGELVEQFQWLTEEESMNLSPEKKQNVTNEIADVLIYALRLCSKLGIDPIKSTEEKIQQNEQKYPIELAKGNAKKYSELQ